MRLDKKRDYLNKECLECLKGNYKEASVQDDMQGVLHCSNCNHEIKRYEINVDKPKY